MKRAFLAVFIVLLCAGMAQAAEIAINSSNGPTSWQALVDLSYGSFSGTSGTAVAIDRHAAWNQSGPDWISYAQTGPNGTVLAPTYNTPISATDPEDQRQAIVSFTRSFTGTAGSTLDMKLWADDTAFMSLDGGAWIPTSHVWGQSTCETNPTSCQASSFSRPNSHWRSPATTHLRFWPTRLEPERRCQTGLSLGPTAATRSVSSTTGSSTVPDGGTTVMLLGGALIGLGVLRRKFRA